MLTFRAQWIVPIAGEPIRNGFVTVDSNLRIQDVSTTGSEHAPWLGRVAVLPALVNAHTHIELSFLQGRVPAAATFNDWVTTLMSVRRASTADPFASPILDAARHAIEQAKATGTGLVGDVSNSLATVPLLREARLSAHVFHELTGFNLPDVPGRIAEARRAVDAARAGADDVRIGLAPHAPYSVSPELFKAIRSDVDAHPHPVTTVHLGESAQEVQFLRDGTGPARAMLERLGVWTDAWRPPGGSPVEYLAGLGFLDARTLVVHGVQFGGDDLARLKTIGATLVSCPRSNVHVGAGSPPLEAFYASGVDVAIGTDSLASAPDLNMFNELAEARRIAPRVPARRLLESATLTGARALGFDRDFGSIEVGKYASFAVVTMPPRRVTDVEEFLVSEVEPGAIRRSGFPPATS
ncbi:MAG TPA: amidohydrolase family protein [Vicinamibacterales bacterium]|nr:amidohydrolase family protein [Vicinamibacterales bacterium]